MSVDVTVVLTSCGRPDLLRRTLDSFFEFNDYPLQRFILMEDSESPAVPAMIRAQYADRVELVVNRPRLGQIRSIDRAYQMVSTRYVFHCEDDWLFYRRGFIRESVEVLLENPHVHQVHLRDLWDNNGHPPERTRLRTASGVSFRLMARNFRAPNDFIWHGFSFNPGLRRLAEYLALGPYEQLGHEEHIDGVYDRRGLRAAILEDGAVEHIGGGRHVLDIQESPAHASGRLRSRLVTGVQLVLPPILTKGLRRLVRTRV